MLQCANLPRVCCSVSISSIGEDGETWYDFCEMLYISGSIVIEDKNLVLFDSLNIYLADHVIIFEKVKKTCAWKRKR